MDNNRLTMLEEIFQSQAWNSGYHSSQQQSIASGRGGVLEIQYSGSVVRPAGNEVEFSNRRFVG